MSTPESLPGRVKHLAGRGVRGALGLMGYRLTRPEPAVPVDFDDDAGRLVERVRPYTLTSPERIFAMREAVRYLEAAAVPGAIVECGVWKGGSMLAALLTLQEMGSTGRELWLYDTFEGMSPAGPLDEDIEGNAGSDLFGPHSTEAGRILPEAPLHQVRNLLESTGYPADRLHFVPGDVAETIPQTVPDQIALLRLDTDWYESTRHELAHLVPLIPDGGVLLIDDYGHWKGARKAVDEYLADEGLYVLLNRIDYSGRLAVIRRALSD